MRVKRGVTARARHNKIRKATKGFTKSNRSSVRRGKQAIVKALENAHRDRRERKRTFRQLWNARINAAARLNGTTYSVLMNGIKKNQLGLDRKVLAELAVNEPKAFAEVVKAASK
ncbi:50S ribosomal protein L20 [Candidatus Saccharibacteria bacterium]|jgi:large subunit ribosomal protein L20|nr:MAG: 50S ribosomal protein L20 [Candidatus Saccharibacteria bacterium]